MLLDVNAKVFYISCGCHCSNLALCDMEKSCVKARNFCTYVQKFLTYTQDFSISYNPRFKQ